MVRVAQFIPEITESRLQQLVHEDVLVNSAVHKKTNSLSGWKIGAFTPPQAEKNATVFTNDRFLALVRCVEAFIAGGGAERAKTAARGFIAGFRQLSQELNTYLSKHRGAFQDREISGPGGVMTPTLENALDKDLAEITKLVGGVAVELKQRFVDEPPGENEVLPVTPPVFSHTRKAISEVNGVHNVSLLMQVVASGAGAGKTGGSAAKKPRVTALSTSQQPKRGGWSSAPSASSGSTASSTDTAARLRAEGVPRNTCQYSWRDGICQFPQRAFTHDRTQSSTGGAGGGRGSEWTQRSAF